MRVYHLTADGFDYVLGFYDDGLVIGASIATPDLRAAWPQIAEWFHRDSASPSIAAGQYALDGDQISFSLTSGYGQVDYSGYVVEDGLVLSSYSHINGYARQDAVYDFLYV